MRFRWLSITVGLLSFALLAGVACDDGSDNGPTAPVVTATEEPAANGEIDVRLFEWTVDVSAPSARAGAITFNARNIGALDHDLVIVRTDLNPDDLPVAEDGAADVADPRLEVVGKIDVFGSGLSRSAEFALEAGTYALICNIVDVAESGTTSHYQEGMNVTFQVIE